MVRIGFGMMVFSISLATLAQITTLSEFGLGSAQVASVVGFFLVFLGVLYGED